MSGGRPRVWQRTGNSWLRAGCPQPEPTEEQPAGAGVGRIGADWDQVYASLAMAGFAMVWAGFNIPYPAEPTAAGFIFPLAGSRSW
jgi:hypothetical protein